MQTLCIHQSSSFAWRLSATGACCLRFFSLSLFYLPSWLDSSASL